MAPGFRPGVRPLPANVGVPPVYRRHPVLSALVAVLVLGAVVDRVVIGRQEDDYGRYHARSFRVVHVPDGCTLEIDLSDRRLPATRVRLWGVAVPGPAADADSPDLPAAEALAVLRDLALDQEVRIELAPTRTRDRERRLLAYAYRLTDGRAVAEQLLEEGAVLLDSEIPHPFSRHYAALQEKAKRRRAGVWANPPDAAPVATSNGASRDGARDGS